MPPPNLLFILSDQQRWDSVGAYGQRLPLTPNLDRLAAEGTRFEHACSCQPVCGPARSCLQTGLFATQTDCFFNGRELPLDAVTPPKLLRPAGYEVAYVGKWHLAGGNGAYHYQGVPPERRGGFDDYWLAADLPEYISSGYDGLLWDADGRPRTFEQYRADAYTDFALEYLAQRHVDRPFFLFLSFVEPHPQPYHARYQGRPPATRDGIINDYLRYDGPLVDRPNTAGREVPGDLVGTEGEWSLAYEDYLASCARVDQNVGRLVEHLRQSDLLDQTLLLYTSDHGCHFRTRNQSDGKGSCHDSSIRVPMILSGPGFAGGAVVEDPVSLIDLPPTVLQAGGVGVPEAMRGLPLQPLVQGDRFGRRESVFAQISGYEVGRAVRTVRWKYAVQAPDADPRRDSWSEVYVETELYDLAADPHERRNLVAEPGLDEVRQELREELLAWMAHAGEPPAAVQPAG